MQTNNHKIVDYDAVLDAKFGKEGTPERARAEEAAYSFYSGQILQDARKRCHHPQCRRILPYHCCPRNEGGSGKACVLSIFSLRPLDKGAGLSQGYALYGVLWNKDSAITV